MVVYCSCSPGTYQHFLTSKQHFPTNNNISETTMTGYNPLSQVIHFRKLASRLTDVEFSLFITQLVDKCGREALLTPFCEKFTNKISGNRYRNIHHFNIAIKIIEGIIKSKRKIKQESSTLSNLTRSPLTRRKTLPKAIISEIGSYLNQKEYIALNNTNRRNWMALNQLNTLKHLNLIYVKHYEDIDIQKYSHIEHLQMRLSKFNEFLFSENEPMLRNLTELTLYGDMKSDIDIKTFITQKYIRFDKVTRLNLYGFGNSRHRFSLHRFMRLVNVFPNIQYLSTCCHIANPDWINVSSLFPNLRGILHGSFSVYFVIITK